MTQYIVPTDKLFHRQKLTKAFPIQEFYGLFVWSVKKNENKLLIEITIEMYENVQFDCFAHKIMANTLNIN
jgi:hypothetical protein